MSGAAFEAGSIFIQLRAVADQLGTAQAAVNQAFTKIDQTATQLAAKMQTAGVKMTAGFSAPAAAAANLGGAVNNAGQQAEVSVARFARFASKLMHVQIAAMALSQAFGEGKDGLSRVVKSVAAGLQTFAMTATAIEGPTGLAIGAVVGLATAMAGLSGQTEEAAKRQEELTKKIAESNAVMEAARKRHRMSQAEFDAQLPIAQKMGLGSGLRGEFAQQQMEDAEKRIAEFEVQLETARGALQDASRAMGFSTETIYDRILSMIGTEGGGSDFEAKHKTYIEAQGVAGRLQMSLEAARKEAIGLADEIANLKKEEASEAVNKARSVLFTQTGEAIKRDADQRIKSEGKALELLTAEGEVMALIEEKYAELAKIDSEATIGGLKEKFAAMLELARRKDFMQTFAAPFSSAIGGGLKDAILNAQKPMEALANIGDRLFGNMVDSFTKKLETSLTSALTSIAGAGGELLGSVLTGVMGIAGGILARRRGGSSSTYGATSGITGSEALRGIVAGPGSVAIASLGDNMERAFVPVLNRMDLALIYLARISSNTGSGKSAAAGGLSYAGTVPA